MNTDTSRDRGILSPADRAYLLGEREMSHDQSARNAEARIRRRIRDAILDFDLLLHTLPAKDRRQVFDEVATDPELLDGLRAMVAFTYVGTKEQGLDFEDVLVPAVRNSEEAYAAKRFDATADVEVTFSVETSVKENIREVAASLQAGEPVTPGALFSLVMQGEYDPADHDEITLVGTEGVDDQFLARLAEYLEADLERVSDSRAVLGR
ncbi:hypothetical protein [Saliphagus infecundisoli]|uniref:Domain of unknown function domain-containing protein n=1 Tax=Saliphagus infecundisoli TaxID=1849069 RepID=A0ABD5QKK9_9EURY|nr:hypothetical protein [Saliphagus infecundisoli]